MRAPSISPRERRTLLLGGGTMLALLLVGRGVPALRAWEQGRVDSAVELVAEQRRAEARAPLAKALSDSVTKRRERLTLLIEGVLIAPARAVAAAELAGVLSDAATGAEMRVQSSQALPDSVDAGSFWIVGARASVIGDVVGLASLLHELEGGTVPLRVRELTVVQPEPAAPSDRPETLRIDILVEALARAGAPPTQSPEKQ